MTYYILRRNSRQMVVLFLEAILYIKEAQRNTTNIFYSLHQNVYDTETLSFGFAFYGSLCRMLIFTFEMNECMLSKGCFGRFILFFMNTIYILLVQHNSQNIERERETPSSLYQAVILIHFLVLRGVDQPVLISGENSLQSPFS